MVIAFNPHRGLFLVPESDYQAPLALHKWISKMSRGLNNEFRKASSRGSDGSKG